MSFFCVFYLTYIGMELRPPTSNLLSFFRVSWENIKQNLSWSLHPKNLGLLGRGTCSFCCRCCWGCTLWAPASYTSPAGGSACFLRQVSPSLNLRPMAGWDSALRHHLFRLWKWCKGFETFHVIVYKQPSRQFLLNPWSVSSSSV